VSQLFRTFRAILDRNKDQHAIPVMDGNLSPNDALERCEVVSDFDAAPDDIAFDADGVLHVSVGTRVLRRTAGPGGWDAVATFTDAVGALAFHPDGRLLACVAGQGLAVIGAQGTDWLREVGGARLECLTSVAVARDGTVYLTQGSCQTRPEDWVTDLMQKNASGMLFRFDPQSGRADVLARALAYPAGVTVTADDRQILYTEAWAHRLTLCDRDGGARSLLVRNFPGYPSRLSPDGTGGYWVCLFGARTHLVELVLSDTEFRAKMMAQIEPDYWIAPSLRATGSWKEPLQGGGIKKLGVVKAWAPPRSYGLVMRISGDGDVMESLHSRVGGTCHGITSARPAPGGDLFIVSKGHQRLVRHKKVDPHD
jgi:sugar lactone lactonase YvrE